MQGRQPASRLTDVGTPLPGSVVTNSIVIKSMACTTGVSCALDLASLADRDEAAVDVMHDAWRMRVRSSVIKARQFRDESIRLATETNNFLLTSQWLASRIFREARPRHILPPLPILDHESNGSPDDETQVPATFLGFSGEDGMLPSWKRLTFRMWS